jgi:TRAP-type C4-dicarboxylate transport system permease small subunit
MIRKSFDFLYSGAGWLAAMFMVGILAMVLAGVLGRLLGFNLAGSDAYAGYCMAAASFLSLAHTLKRGEHIRVTLALDHVGPGTRRVLEVWCHGVGAFIAGALAWFSVHLVWQSYTFHDVSQNSDATPLWIPQIGMAAGAVVLFVALLDDLVALLPVSGVRAQDDRSAVAPAFIE